MSRSAVSFFLIVLFLFVSTGASAGQSPSPGFRLFGANNSTDVLLLDVNNTVVHQWNTSFTPGLGIRLMPDGSLLRAIRTVTGGVVGGTGGGIQRYAFDGTLLWDWRYDGPGVLSHHDIDVLPNGNILMIAWEYKTPAEAIAAGRNPQNLGNVFRSEHIIEVQPTGPTTADIVWEWHLWDHLVQDFDSNQANFGVVASHPELMNLNYPPFHPASGDWLHMNGIDHDPIHDRIVVSLHSADEIWVIDHSTTTAEAAGHTGGTWGRGGDLLYRWGNPAAHGSGTIANQQLNNQHSANFIADGLPGAGNILVFNNGIAALGSAVWEVEPPLAPSGAFLPPVAGVYGPAAPSWSYSDPLFYSMNLSSARRMPNGNTLVCSGPQRWLFEVTTAGQRVWEYVHPGGPIFQAHYIERSLWADAEEISVSGGGSVDFDLVSGTARAGDGYIVLASVSGTSPGTPVGGFTLPLNMDPVFDYAFLEANGPFLPQTLGVLDSLGRATAAFVLPPASPPPLVGWQLHFAFGTWNPGTLAITSTSQPVPVSLLP